MQWFAPLKLITSAIWTVEDTDNNNSNNVVSVILQKTDGCYNSSWGDIIQKLP